MARAPLRRFTRSPGRTRAGIPLSFSWRIISVSKAYGSHTWGLSPEAMVSPRRLGSLFTTVQDRDLRGPWEMPGPVSTASRDDADRQRVLLLPADGPARAEPTLTLELSTAWVENAGHLSPGRRGDTCGDGHSKCASFGVGGSFGQVRRASAGGAVRGAARRLSTSMRHGLVGFSEPWPPGFRSPGVAG